MPRIVIIVHTFPCVSETFVVDHVVGLAQRGFQTSVVCDAADEERLEPVSARVGRRLAVTVLSRAEPSLRPYAKALCDICGAVAWNPRTACSSLGRSLLSRVPALSRALRELRPDVVHAHFASNGLVAAHATRGRVPLVVDMHGWDFNVMPKLVGWAPLRIAFRQAVLVAHSAFAVERIQAGMGRAPRHVHLGVDLQLFRTPPRPYSWGRPLRLLCVGRLVLQKGHAVAIAALSELRNQPDPVDAMLKIIGDGPERYALEGLARRRGLSNAVQFVGSLTHAEVAREMSRADVLLVPSIRSEDGAEEAFGRVAIEGLAAGLPVIVTTTGGLAETVGLGGWTVPPGDPVALAKRVREIISGHSPHECGWSARSHAAGFSLERMWDEYEEVALNAGAG